MYSYLMNCVRNTDIFARQQRNRFDECQDTRVQVRGMLMAFNCCLEVNP